MSKKRLMRLKLKMKQKRPHFKRQEWFKCKRIGTSWRHVRGLHSGMRKKLANKCAIVNVGYRCPVEVRGLHPSGFEDILVHNVKELEALNPETQGARIASTVGKKKKIEIVKKAIELNIKILNISKDKQDELLNPPVTDEVVVDETPNTEEVEKENNNEE